MTTTTSTLPSFTTVYPDISRTKLGLDRFPALLSYAEKEWRRISTDLDAEGNPVAVYSARTHFLPCVLTVTQ